MATAAPKEVSTTKKQRFEVEIRGYFVLELSQDVIDQVLTEEWRNTFYKIYTPEEVAEHVAFAMIVRGFELQSLDGFANLPKDSATLMGHEDWDTMASLIKEPEKKPKMLRKSSQKPRQLRPFQKKKT
jgi:hypothetical protein